MSEQRKICPECNQTSNAIIHNYEATESVFITAYECQNCGCLFNGDDEILSFNQYL